jgi:hypothetical protein
MSSFEKKEASGCLTAFAVLLRLIIQIWQRIFQEKRMKTGVGLYILDAPGVQPLWASA